MYHVYRVIIVISVAGKRDPESAMNQPCGPGVSVTTIHRCKFSSRCHFHDLPPDKKPCNTLVSTIIPQVCIQALSQKGVQASNELGL